MSSSTHDGRRVVLHVGLVIAFLGAVASGLASYVAATFTIWDPVDPSAYREAAIAVGVVAVLVGVLGAWEVWALRASPLLGLLLVPGVLLLAAVAADAWNDAETATPDRDGHHQQVEPGNVGAAVAAAAILPTGWPILGFGVGAAVVQGRRVRERSSRERRAPRVRSSAHAGPR